MKAANERSWREQPKHFYSCSLYRTQMWPDCCFAGFLTITLGTKDIENISGGCQEVRSGVQHVEIGGLSVFLCCTKAVLTIEANGRTKLPLHVTGGAIR